MEKQRPTSNYREKIEKDAKAQKIAEEIMKKLKRKTNLGNSKEAIEKADILSDMVLFHRKVRENERKMKEEWEKE